MMRLLFILTLILPLSATAGKVEVTQKQPEVIAAMMHADWCGACKAMAPKLKQVKAQLKDANVLFITFDLTDEQKIVESAKLASVMGLSHVLSANAVTGQMFLIEPNTKKVTDRVTVNNSVEDIVYLISEMRTKK